jgi:hypothetical protein
MFEVSSDPPVIPGNSSRVKSTKGKSKCVKDDSSGSKSKRKRGFSYKCTTVDEPIVLALKFKETIEEVFVYLDLYISFYSNLFMTIPDFY